MQTKNKIMLMLAAVAVLATLFAGRAMANPSKFAGSASTAAATTTRAYISAGAGTTTLLYDSYAVLGSSQVNIGDTVPTDSATMLVSMSASSTAGILNMNVEYSQDNVDWYQDTFINTFAYSTTSASTTVDNLGVPQYYWRFASSTAGLGAVGAQSATTTRAIPVKTPTRFIRVVFTTPIGASPVNVWATIIPKEERPEGR